MKEVLVQQINELLQIKLKQPSVNTIYELLDGQADVFSVAWDVAEIESISLNEHKTLRLFLENFVKKHNIILK